MKSGIIAITAFTKQLLFMIPAIPHAETDFGLFAKEEEHEHDLLNDIEHNLTQLGLEVDTIKKNKDYIVSTKDLILIESFQH